MAELLGSAPGIIIGTGVGAAAAVALEPAFELPRQKAWSDNPNKLLDPAIVARLVAQGAVELADGRADAKREGFGPDKFDALVYLAQTVPGFAEALSLWRKRLLDDDLFKHTLAKAGLDQRYVEPIVRSKLAELIGLGDIAVAVVRGLLPAPPWLPVAP